MQHSRPTKGSILITTLVFASIAVIMISGLVTWFGGLLKGSQYVVLREQAFQVAEAGIEYYRWHLAHAQSDYYDGQGASSTGPYVHDFFDKDGVKL
jgi:type II secretory pathway component PulK